MPINPSFQTSIRNGLRLLPIGAMALCAASSQAQITPVDILYLPGGRTLSVPSFRIYTASGYTPSDENIAVLRAAAGGKTPFRLIAFDGGPDASGRLWCRGSFPVDAPGKQSFDTVLEGAVNLELVQAKVLSEQADDKVKGHLEYFDFTSFGEGTWKIKVTFSSAGKEPVTIEHTHPFELSLLATKSCAKVTAAIVPAIQGFWRAAYESAQFLALMNVVSPTVAVKQDPD